MVKNIGKIIMTVIIIIVMVSSVIGFVFSDISQGGNSMNVLSYNGFSFKQASNGYTLEQGGKTLLFSFLPSNVDFIALNSSVLAPLNSTKMAYITSDANSKNAIAMGGFTYTVGQALSAKGSYGVQSFTSSNEFNRPVVTCANATSFVPVIYVQDSSNTTEMHLEGNCIVVNAATPTDIERLGNRLAYAILGVIE
jgi:hypothetical protein